MNEASDGPLSSFEIVRITDRPDLITTVAQWRWLASWRNRGRTIAETEAMVATYDRRSGIPQCLVLLHDGCPVGTASLVEYDLAERPDLHPWISGVVVDAEHRNKGHGSRLVRAVEHLCRAETTSPLWLYTYTAETLYSRLGWIVSDIIPRIGKPTVTLMRRDL